MKTIILPSTDLSAKRLWWLSIFVESIFVVATILAFIFKMPDANHDRGAGYVLIAFRVIFSTTSLGFLLFMKFFVYKLIRHEPFWKRWFKFFRL